MCFGVRLHAGVSDSNPKKYAAAFQLSFTPCRYWYAASDPPGRENHFTQWHSILRWIVRHRLTLRDVFLLLACMATAALLAIEIDLFTNGDQMSARQREIELDEALALGALLSVGLLLMSWRLLRSQRRETQRRIEAERRARELALQDALTGLPNRRRFDQEIKAAVSAPPRANGAHAVLLLDLNGFKRVNDVYGHGTGDEVLIEVAARLQQAVREGDLAVRLGGDEFAILARQLVGAEDATSIALRVTKAFEQPVTIGSTRHDIGVGIGIALFPQDGADSAEILRKADIALYRAKSEPGSASRFFEAEMDAHMRERDLIERELRAAIAEGTVVSHFQPLIDLQSQRITGFEALARWTHPTLGEVPPERFIPIAESCGLIYQLTEALLRQATRAAAAWPPDVTLSFNISPVLLREPTLGLHVLSILGETGFSPQRLELELTESALVSDMEAAQRTLGALHAAGVRIALDDFGTGYSNLYHLRNFKVDRIKIDRSFVDRMELDPNSASLVRALMGLGHGLGLTITAEGVERPEQATALLDQGCQHAQGFLYSKAVPADVALDLLAARQGDPPAGVGAVSASGRR
jgi:diguanylate cyclase (GGDEF)-like protein